MALPPRPRQGVCETYHGRPARLPRGRSSRRRHTFQRPLPPDVGGQPRRPLSTGSCRYSPRSYGRAGLPLPVPPSLAVTGRADAVARPTDRRRTRRAGQEWQEACSGGADRLHLGPYRNALRDRPRVCQRSPQVRHSWLQASRVPQRLPNFHRCNGRLGERTPEGSTGLLEAVCPPVPRLHQRLLRNRQGILFQVTHKLCPIAQLVGHKDPYPNQRLATFSRNLAKLLAILGKLK
mmetsp:Transcript_18082/g.31199  ORF Transcript_18082/g.31199 Transcript_18082/m.31199 type:complete len:235 (-) Transcript_18082:550-1254(-)